jgi:hypothetical protein
MMTPLGMSRVHIAPSRDGNRDRNGDLLMSWVRALAPTCGWLVCWSCARARRDLRPSLTRSRRVRSGVSRQSPRFLRGVSTLSVALGRCQSPSDHIKEAQRGCGRAFRVPDSQESVELIFPLHPFSNGRCGVAVSFTFSLLHRRTRLGNSAVVRRPSSVSAISCPNASVL